MNQEIIDIDKRDGYLVTIQFTPSFLGKLFGRKPYQKKYHSCYGHIWHDAETYERLSWVPGGRLLTEDITGSLLDDIREQENKLKLKIKLKRIMSAY